MMSPEEKTSVHAILRKEMKNRVIDQDAYDLYDCLASLIDRHLARDEREVKEHLKELTNPENIRRTLVQFLSEHSRPIMGVLPLLDAHYPLKKKEVNAKDYQHSIERYFQNVLFMCWARTKYHYYLELCLFAAATCLNVHIYILSRNEVGKLQWQFVNPWQYEGQRRNVLPYLTMYMSQSKKFFRIESRDWYAEPPTALGQVGTYLQILEDTPVQDIDVPQQLLELKDKTVLGKRVSCEVVKECCNFLLQQDFVQKDEYEMITSHRASRERFCELISRNENAHRCLCQVLIKRREKTLLSEYVEDWETFVKSGNYLAQISAVIALDTAINKRNDNLSQLRGNCLDGSREIDERRKKVTTAVIAGSSMGVVSSAMVITGLALTPVSFGASLGLSIAGGAIGVGTGVTSGGLRVLEAVKQNEKMNIVKENLRLIEESEKEVFNALNEIYNCFKSKVAALKDSGEECPGKSMRGFLAVGSLFRASHSAVSIILAAVRVSATAAAVSASVLGPLSLVFDLTFLAEAAHNKRKGDKTNAGKLLKALAESVDMKCIICNSILHGNYENYTENGLLKWN